MCSRAHDRMGGYGEGGRLWRWNGYGGGMGMGGGSVDRKGGMREDTEEVWEWEVVWEWVAARVQGWIYTENEGLPFLR